MKEYVDFMKTETYPNSLPTSYPKIGITVKLFEFLLNTRERKQIMCGKCGCKKFLVFPHQVFRCEQCKTEAENFKKEKMSTICNLSADNNSSNFYWEPIK